MLIRTEQHSPALNLRAGELVEVRSKAEILATLDKDGLRNALPFMPEMLKFCGKQFRVSKSAHKTCDTIDKTGGRRMDSAVHLDDLRCDGEAHGGCQAGCLLFWHEAWLKRPDRTLSTRPDSQSRTPRPMKTVCSEETLKKSTVRAPDDRENGFDETQATYRCQATELLQFTTPLKWWDIRQYIKDVTTRNVKVSELISAAAFRVFVATSKLGGYRLLTSVYDRIQAKRGGTPFPYRSGELESVTPNATFGLCEGEVVQVKSQAEILETVNKKNMNRGLSFDPEMTRYCGGSYKVLRKVDRIVNEKTGKLMKLPNAAFILDGVTCGAHFSKMRLFCPRALYSFWREAWLRRLDD